MPTRERVIVPFPFGEPANPSGFKFSDEVPSPYVNAEQGARYLQMFVKDDNGRDTTEPNLRAFYQFLKRHNITPLGDRRVLVDKRELDRALQPVKSMRADLCLACKAPTSAHIDSSGSHRGCAYAVRHARRIS